MFPFYPGDFLRDFRTDSSINPSFIFNSLGGRRFLLAFVGTVQTEGGRLLAEALLAEAERLKHERILVFVVTTDPKETDHPVLARLVQRYTVFWDRDRAICKLYGMDATPCSDSPTASVLRLGVLLVRENLRLQAAIAAGPAEAFGDRLRAALATLPAVEPLQTVRGQAPVLSVPDVLDAETCRRLIDHYETNGGTESGFMRDVDGQTRGHLDPAVKRRRDLYIRDPDLQAALRTALIRRVLPEITKAFAYHVTRIERYMIGCYDDTDHGFFREHRDNQSKATSHRAFAVSLNLNSEDYEGGALRFPEYGPYLYKPATGSCVVFSCSLLHEALPVIRGRRYVVLPFLYDESAATRRAENVRFLSDAAPERIGQAAGG